MKTELKLEPELLRFADGREVKNAADWAERRKELVDILAREEYGYMPPVMGRTRITFDGEAEKCCAGFGRYRKATISFDTPKGEFSFPVKFAWPANGKKNPGFILMNFRDRLYDQYLPTEEVIGEGFSAAIVYYNDITSDDGNMNDKLCGMYDRPTDGTGYGKISLWAFAMSRVMDCLGECEGFDLDNIAAIGHSRLGKTALWCGANDERIKYVISNCSGCGGASSERIKHEGAEKISHMNVNFPFWFCENRAQYADKPDSMPFDQHFLLAAAAPRYLFVGSAVNDTWADPYSEQLSCLNASPAWEINGLKGYTGPEEPMEADSATGEGMVYYHIRSGDHFLSRVNWHYYMRKIANESGR